mmetsp:Transcript_17070/g.36834  ORF Transcript_17070/g.36834 Transcript_17070/m.36834 type:complete len:88 (+) Transcript_17070:302-565(+)
MGLLEKKEPNCNFVDADLAEVGVEATSDTETFCAFYSVDIDDLGQPNSPDRVDTFQIRIYRWDQSYSYLFRLQHSKEECLFDQSKHQ